VNNTLSRRSFLRGVAVAGGALVAGRTGASLPRGVKSTVGPWLIRSADRPAVTHGVQSGDVTARSAVVWARADRPARLWVEVAPTESFERARRLRGPLVTPDTDLTGKLEIRHLPPGSEVCYRVQFESVDERGVLGEPASGRFRTAPDDSRPVSFVWSGDTAGQGWGINPDVGGMRTYEAMRGVSPDFFVHSGDTIYADNPIAETVAMPDGSVWRNLTTEEKAKVAETIVEFRGNHKYNLLDENVRRFNAEVPVLAQWDDHETLKNWYPGEVLDDPRYTVKDVDLLASRARQAFHEFTPLRTRPPREGRIYRVIHHGPLLDLFLIDMRSFRGPNSANDQREASQATAILGRRQLNWLKSELRRSRAPWKAIASDMPLGLVVPDRPSAFDAVANHDGGRPLGRELEIADLLSFIAREQITGVVWFTADVHYTAAHRYEPSRAAFKDFLPFWEFVSGPLHAGTFGPNDLDNTFGPEVVYQKAAPTRNQPPSAGLQFFGHVRVERDAVTAGLMDVGGQTLHTVRVDTARD
jgi:alkaline phosphatase D